MKTAELLEDRLNDMPYVNAFGIYDKLTFHGQMPALLMESRTLNLAYGRQSIVAANLALKVSGKNEGFRIDALNEQGIELLAQFSREDFPFAADYRQAERHIGVESIRAENSNYNQNQRIRASNASKFLRAVMGKFKTAGNHFGLYGAFAYDFVRHFEDIGHKHDAKSGDDFTLFFPTAVYVFDDIRQAGAYHSLGLHGNPLPFEDFKDTLRLSTDVAQRHQSMTDDEFLGKVASIVMDIKNGRFMQCVLSRSFSLPLKEHPLDAYARLREANPSPYCFFFNFGKGEFLYGSSPEIHAVVENNTLTIRPLAGTIPRSQNPLEDADKRIKLLTDEKERREHLMLLDLARNDVFRLCDPASVHVTDALTVEQYPNLYHLASGVSGKLRNGFDSIDVLSTITPAGTLSGAPKLEAMRAIEGLENTRRGFYGGAVGYLSNGGCNTGITIRSVHVKDGFSTVQAGAGIVADSIPENEAKEVMLKLSMPMKNLEAR